ncbi:hypothetical protein V1519DRAFT_431680 [Lipomyces tetrasporus]
MAAIICARKRARGGSFVPTLALNRALLKPEKKASVNGWTIPKYTFFLVTFGASFVYFWLPNYIFQALSKFNWITWIAPGNFTGIHGYDGYGYG